MIGLFTCAWLWSWRPPSLMDYFFLFFLFYSCELAYTEDVYQCKKKGPKVDRHVHFEGDTMLPPFELCMWITWTNSWWIHVRSCAENCRSFILHIAGKNAILFLYLHTVFVCTYSDWVGPEFRAESVHVWQLTPAHFLSVHSSSRKLVFEFYPATD